MFFVDPYQEIAYHRAAVKQAADLLANRQLALRYALMKLAEDPPGTSQPAAGEAKPEGWWSKVKGHVKQHPWKYGIGATAGTLGLGGLGLYALSRGSEPEVLPEPPPSSGGINPLLLGGGAAALGGGALAAYLLSRRKKRR
jgi:hypothetical protein